MTLDTTATETAPEAAPVTETPAAAPAAEETTQQTETPAAEPEKPAAAVEGDTNAEPQTASTAGAPVVVDLEVEFSALSKEERVKYAEDLKKLDAASRKTFNALLTQKSQAAAEEKKAAAAEREKLAAAAQLLQQLDADPDTTLKQLEERARKQAEAKKATESKATPTTEPSADVVKAIADRLPDESKPLAPVLAPIITAIVGDSLKDVKAYIEEKQTEAKVAQAQAIAQEFEKTHPDWKTHEAKMRELVEKFPRKAEVAEPEYLEAIYTLASAGTVKADAAAAIQKAQTEKAEAVIERVTKAAAAAEPESPTVTPARVANRRTQAPTIQEAFEAAKRGEEFVFD